MRFRKRKRREDFFEGERSSLPSSRDALRQGAEGDDGKEVIEKERERGSLRRCRGPPAPLPPAPRRNDAHGLRGCALVPRHLPPHRPLADGRGLPPARDSLWKSSSLSSRKTPSPRDVRRRGDVRRLSRDGHDGRAAPHRAPGAVLSAQSILSAAELERARGRSREGRRSSHRAAAAGHGEGLRVPVARGRERDRPGHRPPRPLQGEPRRSSSARRVSSWKGRSRRRAETSP